MSSLHPGPSSFVFFIQILTNLLIIGFFKNITAFSPSNIAEVEEKICCCQELS